MTLPVSPYVVNIICPSSSTKRRLTSLHQQFSNPNAKSSAHKPTENQSFVLPDRVKSNLPPPTFLFFQPSNLHSSIPKYLLPNHPTTSQVLGLIHLYIQTHSSCEKKHNA